MEMVEFDKIKLVIWDLDETFWQGTLMEGGAEIPEVNRALLQKLTDVGIVNSICSKNDPYVVEKRLREEGLWDLFVFPSVNWEPKGARVKQLIADMQLRAVNVLFLDDNHSNREEARFFCPEIMTEGPELIPELCLRVRIAVKKTLNTSAWPSTRFWKRNGKRKATTVPMRLFFGRAGSGSRSGTTVWKTWIVCTS